MMVLNVQEQHPYMGVLLLQVLQAQVKSSGDGILSGVVAVVCKSMEMIWSFSTPLKHFRMVDVSATGRKSLRQCNG